MNSDRPLTLLPDRFAVCRFEPDAPLPAWVFHDAARLWCVMRTPDELSVVCPEDDLPPSVTRAERGWRALKVEGPIPFGEVGVIAGLTAPLAAAGVPVFVLSTYDTDYLLVKEADLERARAALGGRIAPGG
jgi:hypothetical protein